VLKQIERFEFAQELVRTAQMQDAQFAKTQESIEKARAARMRDFEDVADYAVIGKLSLSSIYGDKNQPYYRVVDDDGRTICYAVGSGAAARMDMSRFLNKKVGLKGMIEPHPATKGALVRFNGVEAVD
jgi:hypothetical protein